MAAGHDEDIGERYGDFGRGSRAGWWVGRENACGVCDLGWRGGGVGFRGGGVGGGGTEPETLSGHSRDGRRMEVVG